MEAQQLHDFTQHLAKQAAGVMCAELLEAGIMPGDPTYPAAMMRAASIVLVSAAVQTALKGYGDPEDIRAAFHQVVETTKQMFDEHMKSVGA